VTIIYDDGPDALPLRASAAAPGIADDDPQLGPRKTPSEAELQNWREVPAGGPPKPPAPPGATIAAPAANGATNGAAAERSIGAERSGASEPKSPAGRSLTKGNSAKSSSGRISGSWRRNRQGSESGSYTAAEHAKATNKNLVSAYAWTADLLESIALNKPLQVTDLATGRTGFPMFAVYGACPNSFCGMQAVMYVHMDGEKGPPIDFWWIKPKAKQPDAIETATFNRHSKGAHKNDPGRSRPLYAQFSSLFENKPVANAKLTFGMVAVGGCTRAYIDMAETGERLWIYLIWQEAWSGLMSRNKYIKGKIVYQKDPKAEDYYARPYTYRESSLEIPAAAATEERIIRAFPDDTLKRMPTSDIALD